jgi:hypothetical protein
VFLSNVCVLKNTVKNKITQLNGNRLNGVVGGTSIAGMTSLTRINFDGNMLREKIPAQV